MITFLNHLVTVITNFSTSEVCASLGVISEVVMRLVPSSKPLSWLYAIEGALSGLAALASAANQALNKIIPQNTSTS